MSRKIRVGSRESTLAVIQARLVIDAVKKANPAFNFEIVTIKTTGDKILDRSLDSVGGKGLFVREIEQALADGSIDMAVHSYKDMPYEETDGLPVVALSEREAPFDVLVLPKGATALENSKPVGSSSLRRSIQFARLYSGFETKAVRGNVPTRLSKLDNGEYSALLLAQAGLNRLSLQNRISRVFTVEEMLPSASQGILAVQGRQGEDYSFLKGFHNRVSEIVSKAERQFLRTLGGNCSSPVAVYGQLHNSEILLTGMYVDADGNIETGKISGDTDRSEQLGEQLALCLKDKRNIPANFTRKTPESAPA
ncbi:MAG: hydroxymethylbilane synthase [Candidatus Fibromonas sp.]|jgi:hydroxymethylbilane synthase|nr:hydroxymethylbilane synthase [Candidatus Fibromonas sp.]